MYVLGVTEAVELSVRTYYARWGYGYSGHVFRWDVQAVAIFLIASTTACVHAGTNKAMARLSNVLCGVLLASVSCMVVGCALFAMGLNDGNLQPYDRSFMENLWPKYEPDPFTGVVPDFFRCLALVYPCVTGILAGMSRSHVLKSPAQSIPTGTLWAIITCTAVYLVVCWLFGMVISNRTLKVDKFVTASVAFPHELIVRAGVVFSGLGMVLTYTSTAPNILVAMSSDGILPFLAFLGGDNEWQRGRRALWCTALLVVLPTLGGNLDHVSHYASISYLLMYSGINAATCISGYVRPPGFRPTHRYFHWSVSGLGFVWCLGLSFCISGVGTFISLLFLLLMYAYIKKVRRLAKSGIKWGTLGDAVRYNIMSSVLNSLAKSAATPVPTEVTLSMREEGVHLRDGDGLSSLASDGSVLVGNADHAEEWVHFQSHSDFHAKNWRPQLLTITDVDRHGHPTSLHLISLAAHLQQTGRGINVVISIIDRQKTIKAASVASAIDNICAEANTPFEDAADERLSKVSSFKAERWQRGYSLNNGNSGIDNHDTVKLIQHSKSILMHEMNERGMDGFAEVSTTDGNFLEAVWSAVIHTGLGPLSPNTVLLGLPFFLTLEADADNTPTSITHEQDIIRAEEYLRTISGILNLGKAVILFKGTNYPKSRTTLESCHSKERSLIDIWWIVSDGGLLLLLPLLLSKHSIWNGMNKEHGTRSTPRLRRQRSGAQLRLFAVPTGTEHSDKLHQTMVEELSRLRINAEVIVVDCLAGTNIAKCWRGNLVKGGSNLDLTTQNQKESLNGATCSVSLQQNMDSQSWGLQNPDTTVEKDEIDTPYMTSGEGFASEDCEESLVPQKLHFETSLPKSSIPGERNDSTAATDEGTKTATRLNEAMRKYSSDANLVVTNLPIIDKNQCAPTYFQFLERVCNGIDNVMLVRGSGAEVITTYA